MLDRIVVIRNQNLTEFFYVPPPSCIDVFIKRVIGVLKASEQYNDEIQNIRNMLTCECDKVNTGKCTDDITPAQAQEIIDSFTASHPLDNRTLREVIKDAGAVELEKSIPKENFIKPLYK